MALDPEKLLSDFITEAVDLLEKSEMVILELETDYDPTKVNNLFRYIHTVKGNSGMFEFPSIHTLAHKMETLMDNVRANKFPLTKEITDVLLQGIDRLKAIMGDIRNEKSYDIQDLEQKLYALENGPTDTQDKALPTEESLSVEGEEVLDDSPKELLSFDIFEFDSYIKMAKEQNMYLALVYLDLNKQKFQKFSELIEFFDQNSSTIVYKSVVVDKVQPLEDIEENTIPYQMAFMHTEPIKDLLTQLELKHIEILSLYQPKFKTLTEEVQKDIHEQVSWMKDEKASTEEEKSKESPLQQVTEAMEAIGTKPLQSAPTTKKVVAKDASETHIKVKIGLLDDLINLVGETIITRNQLLQRAAIVNDSEGNVILSRMSQLITQLHEKIMHTRLVELNIVFYKIRRLVRDISAQLGKKVDLILDGGDVELDKTMIDVISDAIIHMIRNSIDHGIESPEERLKVGKKEVGRLSVTSHLQTGNVQLVIEDDGKGLDTEKIREKAIANGLLGAEEAKSMLNEDIDELIFAPGLSTAKNVTETSGRGVGMDVVKSSFKKLGGSIRLQNNKGKGLKFIATIPQTVSVISCLLIAVANRRFALFQKYISELIRFDPNLYSVVNGHKMYRLRDRFLPLVHLGSILFPDKEFEYESSYIVVVKSETHHFGILFDQMLGTEEIVIKPLGEHFRDLSLFSGATIMGDGEAVLILDVAGIAESSQVQVYREDKLLDKSLQGFRRDAGYVLFQSSQQYFATLSSSVVCIEKIKFTKIEKLSGFDVVQYKNDIIPIVRLEEIYDVNFKEFKDDVYVIIIKIGTRNMGILIHEILDVVNDIEVIQSDRFQGESILGHSLINGHTTIVIDAVELLTRLNNIRFKWLGQHLNN